MKFEWNEELATYIEVFDDHHRYLVELINNLFKVPEDNQEEFIVNTVNQLYDYAGYHFKAEEDAMKKRDFPGLAEHRAEHQAFTEKIGEYLAVMEFGNLPPLSELQGFLTQWLVNHVKEMDQKYAPFLKERGL